MGSCAAAELPHEEAQRPTGGGSAQHRTADDVRSETGRESDPEDDRVRRPPRERSVPGDDDVAGVEDHGDRGRGGGEQGGQRRCPSPLTPRAARRERRVRLRGGGETFTSVGPLRSRNTSTLAITRRPSAWRSRSNSCPAWWWTRVRFPPPPPFHQRKQLFAQLLFRLRHLRGTSGGAIDEALPIAWRRTDRP